MMEPSQWEEHLMALRFICRSFGPFFLGSEWKVPAEISGVMDDVCCPFFQDGFWICRLVVSTSRFVPKSCIEESVTSKLGKSHTQEQGYFRNLQQDPMIVSFHPFEIAGRASKKDISRVSWQVVSNIGIFATCIYHYISYLFIFHI